MRPTVTLLGAPGCCLCDEAYDKLITLQHELSFDLIEQDITKDEDLHKVYLERIPVVLLNGRAISHYYVDEQGLRESLARPVAIVP